MSGVILFEDSVIVERSERLNVHVDDGQTVRKRRPLTYNLKQPTQEMHAGSMTNNPGGQPAI